MTDYLTKTDPFPKQVEAFDLTKDKRAFAYFCKMRTGKSKMILDEACDKFLAGKINLLFIAAPNGVQQNWVLKEAPQHLACDYKAIACHGKMNVGEKKQLKKLLEHVGPDHLTIITINFEQLRFHRKATPKFREWMEVVEPNKTMMIVDESQFIKSPSSQITKGCIRLGDLAKCRRIASGSPMPKGPEDIFSQARFLGNGFLPFSNYVAFKAHFCHMQNIENPSWNPDNPKSKQYLKMVVGYKNESELKDLISKWSFSCTLEEMIGDQGTTIVPGIRYVEFTPQQRRMYKELKQQALTTIENPPEGMSDEDLIEWMLLSGEARVKAKNGLVSAYRMLELGGGFIKDEEGVVTELDNNRPKALMEFITEIEDEKAVIWACRTAELEDIVSRLADKYGPESVVHYYGATTKEDRIKAINDLNDPTSPVRFFVANPQAAGRGIDLAGSHHMIWYTLPNHNFELYVQACARQQGAKQNNIITLTHFVALDSRDEKVMVSNEDKRIREHKLVFEK